MKGVDMTEGTCYTIDTDDEAWFLLKGYFVHEMHTDWMEGFY